jgi:hypothetical protein
MLTSSSSGAKAPLKAKHLMSEPFEAQDLSGTALSTEECVAPPVLAFYTLRTQRLRAGLTCDAPTALGEGGACRRRGRRGRGGGRRVRRR